MFVKKENMNWMFSNTTIFNQSIDSWDISSVKNLSFMFMGLNYKPDLKTRQRSLEAVAACQNLRQETKMYKNTKRAERRHHYNRLKKRRVEHNYWGQFKDNDTSPWTKPNLGMAVNTSCNCSCTMCGNPRRHFGERTLAERRNEDSIKDQIIDCD